MEENAVARRNGILTPTTRKFINNTYPFESNRVYTFKNWRGVTFQSQKRVVVSFAEGDYTLPAKMGAQIIHQIEEQPPSEQQRFFSRLGVY